MMSHHFSQVDEAAKSDDVKLAISLVGSHATLRQFVLTNQATVGGGM